MVNKRITESAASTRRDFKKQKTTDSPPLDFREIPPGSFIIRAGNSTVHVAPGVFNCSCGSSPVLRQQNASEHVSQSSENGIEAVARLSRA